MTHLIEEPKQQAQQSDARPYHAPRLFVYGAMRELTAGGTSDMTENTAAAKNSQAYKKLP